MNATITCRCGRPKEKLWHLVCAPCWAKVPPGLQVEVYEAYREQDGSPRHIAAVRQVWEALRPVMFPERLRAISIRQPWAWAIIHAGKDIENRCWSTKVRGRVLIHAAKAWDDDEFCDAVNFMKALGITLPDPRTLEHGGIIGSVEVVDCVSSSTSPWFCGRFGFVLRDPRPLPFVALRGQLSFFGVPAGLVK